MEELKNRRSAGLLTTVMLSTLFALAAQAEELPDGCTRAIDFSGSLRGQSIIVDKESDQGRFDAVFSGIMDSGEDLS